MKAKCPTRSAALVLIALVLVSARGRGESRALLGAEELAATLAEAGDRVEAFFSRAQSLVCTETVQIRQLDSASANHALGRTVESELRLWWEAGADGAAATAAQTKRQVLTVNKRPPRKDDPNSCTVPEQEDTETPPLSMLLPDQRGDYAFTGAGTARVDGRAAVMVDFRHLTPVSVDVRKVADNEDCLAYDVNGGFRGRLWIDTETRDVLRMDQRLGGLVDVRVPRDLFRRPGTVTSWTLERWDTSIRFGHVAFADPVESLVLPISSTTLQITRGSGSGRLRTETKYANYKRFLTSGRVIG